MTWEEARDKCMSRGEHLFEPKNSTTTDKVKQLATSYGMNEFWTAISKSDSEKLGAVCDKGIGKFLVLYCLLAYCFKTRLKMSNPYPHDVHIYLPNFKPNYVNRGGV